MKVKEIMAGLELNGAHNFLVYADYVNLMGENINIINKSWSRRKRGENQVNVHVSSSDYRTESLYKGS
jgi:hypothetical protein